MQNQNEDNQNKALDEVREFMRVQEEIQSEKKKSFFQGLVAGLLLSMGITFFTMSAVQIFQQSKFAKNGQSREETVGENVTDALVVDKLGVLEEAIDKYFWQDVEDQTLQNGVYKGLLAALDDPYSVYYTTEELIALQEQTEGIYYGIGAYISQDKETGYVQISKIIKNTPAEESNLMQGDYIYAINGESMQGKDSTYVVSKIKGEEGSYVTITVIREGVSEPLDIEVERRKIESPTVEYEMHENGIAYIQITEFDLVTTKQFEDAYKQAKEEGMRGLIIDLRSNPGGNLSTVCDIARMILPKGLIVYTEDKYGERDEYSCDGKNQIQVPLVVLTNGYSASASEILAGAIKDYEKGLLVGTTTFGKGIVQRILPLTDGTAIKLTVSAYYTPKGNNIHNIGIEPDIICEFDGDAYYDDGFDNQLERGIEEINKMLSR